MTSGRALREDYAGAFHPEVGLGDFSRQALCVLGREYLLIGHLIDRVGIPLVLGKFGTAHQAELAIEEWMGASPIYSKRMQRALGFEGDDVETVFKNLQLDIGAPPQFMDFQFRLDRPDYGEFWLPHCGALLDVEPYGEQQVRLMCHDIEDPTFDATAAATNPRMKMRAIHRPPRVPAGRYPHCRWSVFIDRDSAPYVQHPNLASIEASRIASIPIDVPEEAATVDGCAAAGAQSGGWPDYSGPFDPGFQLEDLSHRALRIVALEAAVQAHLLVRSYLMSVAGRYGEDAARELGARQWVGTAAAAAHRLVKALAIETTVNNVGSDDDGERDDVEAVAKVFQLHPHFFPRTYVDFRVEISKARSVVLTIGPCPALDEGDAYSWFAGLEAAPHPALDAIAGAVNPRARCFPVDPPSGARLAWEVVIDPKAPAQPLPEELLLARVSRGADFELMQRRPLRA